MKTKDMLKRMIEKLGEKPFWLVEKDATLAEIYSDLFEQEDDWMDHKSIPCTLVFNPECGEGRYEFPDGSAIVQLLTGWDVGIHNDWLEDEEVLDFAKEENWDAKLMWPEATAHSKKLEWKRPKPKS